MMKITVLTVGKIKEKFFRDAVAEYEKRLSRYCSLSVVEVADEPTPDKCSEALKTQILEKEGERLLSKMPGNAYRVILDVKGKAVSSEELSAKLGDAAVSGVSHMAFVIGGSLGLSDQIKKSADLTISFSKMTFPHQLMRVVLLEQIYRSYRIMNHEPYHK